MRYVGNRSSGRMGFALAEEAAALGAQVTVVAANVALPRHPRVRYVDVVTAQELAARLRGGVPGLRPAADGRRGGGLPPARARRRQAQEGRPRRARRSTSRRRPTCSARSPPRAAPDQTLVGFAAEHGDGALDYGREKLARKGLDAIVVNDVGGEGIGFDAVDNEVVVLTAADERPRPAPDEGRDRAARSSKSPGRCVPAGGPRRRDAAHGASRDDRARRSRAADAGRGRGRARAGPARQRRGPRRRRGAAGGRRRPDRRAAGRGPRPDRGPAGRRQDDARARRRARAGPRVRARAGHRGPAAGRRRRRERLQPRRRDLRLPARPDLRERRARRRDQPRLAQDAVRACSSACRSGASRSTSTRTRSRARSSCWRRRTRSSSRAPTRCPRRRSTASWSGSRSATRRPTPRPHMLLRQRVDRPRRAGQRRSATAAEVLAAQDAARRVHASDALRAYVVALLSRTRDDRRVELGASPRAGLLLLRAAKARARPRRPRPRAARRRPRARAGRARPPHRDRAGGRRRRRRRRSSPTR